MNPRVGDQRRSITCVGDPADHVEIGDRGLGEFIQDRGRLESLGKRLLIEGQKLSVIFTKSARTNA